MSDGPLLVTSPELGGPIVRTSGEAEGLNGLGLADSVSDLSHALTQGEWGEGLVSGTSVAIGSLGAVLNPFGAISAAGVGWLLEHVRVFSDMLDALAGSPEDITATAATWSTIADELATVADDHARAVAADIPDWQGGAAEAYRAAAGNGHEVLLTVAGAARALHTSVIAAGTVVVAVRSTVRDMIAQAVGELISIALRWAAATVATLGAAVPGAVAEVATRVAAWSARIACWLQKLVQAMRRLGELIEQLAALLGRARTVLREATPVTLLTGGTRFRYQQSATAPGSPPASYRWSVSTNPTGDAIRAARTAAGAASTADDRYRSSRQEQ